MKRQLRNLLVALVAAASVYIYLWFAMDVPQLHHDQPRVFMWGTTFLHTFTGYSGGPLEYIHALLAQLYCHTWTGTAFLTALFAAMYVGSRLLVRRDGSREPVWAPAIPAVLAMVLIHGFMTMAPIIGTVICVYAAILYSYLPLKRGLARVAIFFAAAIFLHYATAGAFFLFVLLCARHEIIKRRPVPAMAMILGSALIPYLARFVFYEPGLLRLYFRHAPLEDRTKGLDPAAAFLFLSMWGSIVVQGTIVRLEAAGRKVHAGMRPASIYAMRGLVVALTLVALAVPPVMRASDCRWTVLERLVAEEEWEEAVALAPRVPEHGILVRHLVNRALYHTGRLLDKMFCYPQMVGAPVLLLDAHECDDLPRANDKRSAVYYDLGMVNRAERWSLEAMCVGGGWPDLLERLAALNMAKGRIEVASTYMRRLKKMPFQRETALAWEARVRDDPCLVEDPEIRRLRDSMLLVDYPDMLDTEELLWLCLKRNAQNRMAFEYVMAHCLLTRQPEKVAQTIGAFSDLGYESIPRHCEEAFVLYMHRTGKLPEGLKENPANPATILRFQNFLAAYRANSKDNASSPQALVEKFGDTYWFYDAYGCSGAAFAAYGSGDS